MLLSVLSINVSRGSFLSPSSGDHIPEHCNVNHHPCSKPKPRTSNIIQCVCFSEPCNAKISYLFLQGGMTFELVWWWCPAPNPPTGAPNYPGGCSHRHCCSWQGFVGCNFRSLPLAQQSVQYRALRQTRYCVLQENTKRHDLLQVYVEFRLVFWWHVSQTQAINSITPIIIPFCTLNGSGSRYTEKANNASWI
jgi:hypothetical protein